MPPTLGRLVPCADNVVSRESSPLKNAIGGGRELHSSSATNLPQLSGRPDGGHHSHMAYGRSQDDLSLTPRSHYGATSMGMGIYSSVNGNWASGGGQDGNQFNQLTRGHASDFFASNGSGGSNAGHRSPRPLQHMHSRDDLDALRPRKTRRTGPSFNSPGGEDPAQSFLSVSPRRDDGDGSERSFIGGEGGPGGVYLNAAPVYAATPDEVPPAAPRRLVSRHNTPSRPERSGAKHGSGSSSSSGAGGGRAKKEAREEAAP